MRLVHVAYFYRFAYFKCASVGLFLSHYHLENGGLTCAVGADYAYYAVLRQTEVEIVVQQFVSERFRHVHSFDDVGSEPWAVRDVYF